MQFGNKETSWRRELARYLSGLRFSFTVTVNYPRGPLKGPLAFERDQILRDDSKRWTRRMLERLYGKKFAARNLNDEFFFAAFIETGVVLEKDHLHLLVRVPLRLWAKFSKYAAKEWRSTDDVEVKLIGDPFTAIAYAVKEVTSTTDRYWFSSQFRKALID